MKKLSLSLIALGAILSLSACSSEPEMVSAANYTLPPRIQFDVRTVGLVDQTSNAPTGITKTPLSYKPSVNEAIRQWAKDRLMATGNTGEAIITIKEASVGVQAIPTEHYFWSFLDRQQASKYVARVAVDVSVRKNGDYGVATAEASRWVSMPEDPSEDERKAAYYEMLNGLMRDLGQGLETNMNAYLKPYIINATKQ